MITGNTASDSSVMNVTETLTSDTDLKTTSGNGGVRLVTEVVVTVSFDSDGGTDVPLQTFLSSGTGTEPEVPVKEGHTFIGWYSVTDGISVEPPFDFSTPVTEDTLLRVLWI